MTLLDHCVAGGSPETGLHALRETLDSLGAFHHDGEDWERGSEFVGASVN